MIIKQKIVTNLVKFYRKLPFKPLRGLLRISYYKFLKSDIQNRTVIKNVDGISYELDLTEVIDSAIYFNQSREPHTTNALKRLCKPGMIVIDIGANVGSHTLPLAKSVGNKGKVYAIEPVPWALDKLRKNLALNRFTNVQIHPIALSDYTDENAEFSLRASFKTTSENPVNKDGGLSESWWNACENVSVRVDTLDNFIEKENIAHVDVIKLDVDGFEVKVLKGAERILQSFKPIILMELAPSWLIEKGDSIEELLSYLTKCGYKFYDETTFLEVPEILNSVRKIKSDSGINVVVSATGLKK
ncbi:FkbM family methyltransferase [uncultured Methylophaga sp.]|uniref:FkbM family methyltransferase n=1 Tax=uncultured Methylophaga sp. TaxID=285271 RepID=UPI0030D6F067